MLSSSWSAKGLVQPAWNQLEVAKDKRGELARLTGIPATNLSAMNTGRMPMTPASAARIVAAVPSLSVLDLGAPAEVADKTEVVLVHELRSRLAEVEEALRRLGPNLDALGALPARVDALEKQARARTPREATA